MGSVAGIPYEADARFSWYYLEDSYVLSIEETDQKILFGLDCILTPEHPEYRPALPNEQYCYRLAILSFDGITSVVWKERSTRFSVDASGEKDFGNIDTFLILPEGKYALNGCWGDLELAAQKASITLVPTDVRTQTPE